MQDETEMVDEQNSQEQDTKELKSDEKASDIENDNSENEQVEEAVKEAEQPPLDSELANIIEAALYAAKEPLGIRKLISLFPDDAQPTKVDIQNVILALQEQCEYRGVELRRIGIGWRYQTKEKYSPWLRKLSGTKAPRYSRALLETLSIIAYRQPVTRGDIEEIRGVGVSSETIRTLEERGWVTQIGHRDVPGRPALFGTSQGFLEYFNMASLSELPELMEKRELQAIAQDMNLTLPMDGVQSEADVQRQQATDANSEGAEVIELHPNKSGGDQMSLSENAEPPSDNDNERDLGGEAAANTEQDLDDSDEALEFDLDNSSEPIDNDEPNT